MKTGLPVHFFTIVLNGMPFMRQHIEVFRELRLDWHWHIIEGVAELTGDTAWSVKGGGRIGSHWHRNALSIDGTTEYLDEVQSDYPHRITVYRKGEGIFWKGKVDMVRAPLTSITEECLLWQIDADEIWAREQIETMAAAFRLHPGRTAAFFWCNYFVGQDKFISTRYGYSQNPQIEWLRVWRYKPGDHWMAHEPPTLTRLVNGDEVDVGRIAPFAHQETEAMGLIFNHYAYVNESQIAFKEDYYGYSGAVLQWQKLQEADLPVRLAAFFPWVHDQSYVDSFSKLCCPLHAPPASPTLPAAASRSEGPILIDGVAWQVVAGGILRYWELILKQWAGTEFGDRIILIDREGTAPRIGGISTISAPRHSYGNRLADAEMLETLCRRHGCTLFASTYYTIPIETKSVFIGHDMIPEVLGVDLNEGGWKSKMIAIYHAALHTAVSRSSCDDLESFYPIVPPSSTRLVPNAVAADFCSHDTDDCLPLPLRSTEASPRGYLLYVGERCGLDGYKNARILFQALPAIHKQFGLKLICVGGREELEDHLMQLAPHAPVTRIAASDQELAQLYRQAFCMIVTSKYEGFGIPVIEAMQSGCPVVCPTHSSLREVGGDAAFYIDEPTPDNILLAVERLQDTTFRELLQNRGRANVARFTSSNSAMALQSALLEAFTAEPRIPATSWRGILSPEYSASSDVLLGHQAPPYGDAELVDLRNQLKAMRTSMSWRITSPYRFIADRLKQL
jgi:glycosyltransferase involved in cell wall biosynthesis